MSSKTDKLENLLTDFLWRAQNLTIGGATASWNQAPVFDIGLLGVTAWSSGLILSGVTFIIRPDANGVLHLLKATTGTAGATAPTAPTANGGTVVDGTITWTDQYAALEAATIAGLGSSLPAELTGGTYARQSVTASLANMAGSQSAGSTTASTGTGATTSNNASLTFNSGGSSTNVGLFFITDAAATNIYEYGFITGGPVAAAAGATLTFAAGQLTIQEDN